MPANAPCTPLDRQEMILKALLAQGNGPQPVATLVVTARTESVRLRRQTDQMHVSPKASATPARPSKPCAPSLKRATSIGEPEA